MVGFFSRLIPRRHCRDFTATGQLTSAISHQISVSRQRRACLPLVAASRFMAPDAGVIDATFSSAPCFPMPIFRPRPFRFLRPRCHAAPADARPQRCPFSRFVEISPRYAALFFAPPVVAELPDARAECLRLQAQKQAFR
jgi:hypothetical protein